MRVSYPSTLEDEFPPKPRRLRSITLKVLICLASAATLPGALLFGSQSYPHEPTLSDLFDVQGAAAAQTPARKPTEATTRSAPSRDDDKIARPKSQPYTGSLSIFEDPKRADRLQIERVMDVLKIGEGKSVADIGAGSGWFSVRAARRVGPGGTVYAVDINRDYLNYIEERAKKENLPNVKTVLGKDDDPLLPANSTDAVLVLKTYHEIAEPIRLMRNLRAALRAGALVGIIDRNGRGDDHGLDAPVVVREMERAGYALVAQYDFVKPDGMDYFLVFRAKS
ncbi:MAG: class I SAM-dependent methyltransferase [Acidobacteria bacterium]|nr:class I SAM-dependent methyltransferase [Acidobacteriota bacterium]